MFDKTLARYYVIAQSMLNNSLLRPGGIDMQNRSRRSLAIYFIVASLVLVCGISGAVEIEVENYRNFNQVNTVASCGETVAVGTTCGALVWDGETLTELSTDTGMSFSQTGHVDIAPDGSVWVSGWGLSRYFEGEFLNFDQFVDVYSIAAVSKDEAWVIGMMSGNYDWLFHVDAGEVRAVEVDIYPQELIIDGFGNMFSAAPGWIFMFDFSSETFIKCPDFQFNQYSLARDSLGFVHAASDEGLWRFNGDQWQLMADGEIWEQLSYGPNGFSITEDGTLWAYARAGLLRRDALGSELITEACGIGLVYDPYDESTWRNGVRGIASMGGAAVVFATRTDGLLIFDGEQFSHIGFADGPPDNIIVGLVEDFHGRDWVAPSQAFLGTGYLLNASWTYFDPEGVFGDRGLQEVCLDTNGFVHFMEYPGRLITFDGAEFLVQNGYDHGITDYLYVEMEPAAGGEIWASFDGRDYYDFSAVARIQGDEWEIFSTKSLFPGSITYSPERSQPKTIADDDNDKAPMIAVAPDNSVWLIFGNSIRKYDGQNWEADSLPTPMPFTQSDVHRVVFDIKQRLVFFTKEGVFRTDFESWTELFEETTWKGLIDADGTLWFITYDSSFDDQLISLKADGTITAIDKADGLADRWFNSLTIDHNGDKWVGTTGGLSRLEDGGPAQQAIELSTSVNPEGVLTVSAQLTNAGRIIPVSLWFACEFGGSLYYYPDWGSTPTPLNLTLSASSIQEQELLNMEASYLPPGDYTFYGGISLLGGMDLLIGARGAKIAVATFDKD